MRNVIVMAGALFVTSAFATLPPGSPEAMAQAKEAKAKSDWSDKVSAYQLCMSQDRVAEAYRKEMKVEGKPAPAPTNTAACADPGPYATPEAHKPLEAAEAHSPTETAKSPPSRNEHASELQGSKKQ